MGNHLVQCRPKRAALKQRSSMWETVFTPEDRTVSCLKSISSSTSISEIIICGQPARLTEACGCPLGESEGGFGVGRWPRILDL